MRIGVRIAHHWLGLATTMRSIIRNGSSESSGSGESGGRGLVGSGGKVQVSAGIVLRIAMLFAPIYYLLFTVYCLLLKVKVKLCSDISETLAAAAQIQAYRSGSLRPRVGMFFHYHPPLYEFVPICHLRSFRKITLLVSNNLVLVGSQLQRGHRSRIERI